MILMTWGYYVLKQKFVNDLRGSTIPTRTGVKLLAPMVLNALDATGLAPLTFFCPGNNVEVSN